MADARTLRAEQKRQRILDVALDLLLQRGPQGTTMEAIAREAGIAKPTLYSYFPDKTSVLETLVDELVLSRAQTFIAVVAGEGDQADLIKTSLTELFGTMADIVEGSPFATEVLGESRRPSAVVIEANGRIVGALSSALGRLGNPHGDDLAAVLMAAGAGILHKYRGGKAVRDAMNLLCSSMIQGVLTKDP